MQRGRGNRTRFAKKVLGRPDKMSPTVAGKEDDGGCEVVQLHGDIDTLRCTLCQRTADWTEEDVSGFLAGEASRCHDCEMKNRQRQESGKRAMKVGTLRPSIVLYGESHPATDDLASITTHDLSLKPDVLLILGTSLQVHGLKAMVREFAKRVHARPKGQGKVIFVNLTPPSESIWKDYLDYWVSMDCDAWVNSLRRHRPDLFQVQRPLALPVTKKATATASAKNPLSDDPLEDKENLLLVQVVSSTIKPRVVVPETPQKKRRLMLGSPAAQRTSLQVQIEVAKVTECRSSQTADLSSQLATPPSSATKLDPGSPSVGKRKRLDAMYGEGLTKRRKMEVMIYEDRS